MPISVTDESSVIHLIGLFYYVVLLDYRLNITDAKSSTQLASTSDPSNLSTCSRTLCCRPASHAPAHQVLPPPQRALLSDAAMDTMVSLCRLLTV